MNFIETRTAKQHKVPNVYFHVLAITFFAQMCPTEVRAVVFSGVVSAWDGDFVSGTTALDTVDGNDGTMLGGVGVGPGLFGNAFDFDGSTGYIKMGNPANLDFGTGPFSLAAWINWDGGGSSIGNIFRKSDFPVSDPTVGYWLRIDGGSSTVDFFSGESPGTYGEINAPVTPNAWHLVVGTRDGAGLMSLYVDGTLQSTVSAPGANTTGSAPFTVGAWDDRFGVIELFSGQMDQLGVYERALTSGEVADLLSEGVPEPSALAVWICLSVASAGIAFQVRRNRIARCLAVQNCKQF